ncbi:MAG: hypothetical protein JXB88_09545 [Spirochaetales bacterium]|nr:hypothetical protein [Spirochaetales bacterium]
MRRKKYTPGEKLRYCFDNFMSKGGFSVFMALLFLFFGAIVIISALRFLANIILPQENMKELFDQWWLSFLQIADGGSIAEDSGSNYIHRIVGIIALFLGLVLFSSLVAFITSQFEQLLTNLRKGKSNVIEKHHTLILGFGDRVLEIIRELIIANESERREAVVVLAEKEKDEMDDFFHDRVENPKTTRIITRSGSTSSLQLLRRVGISSARSVIILNDMPTDALYSEKAIADARVLKTILAVISCTGEENLPSIVAELHLRNKQQLARNISDKISIIDEHSILAKLMVQTSRVSGLAQVYDHLVGFEGNEFYFYRPPGGFPGISYGDLMFHFHTCSVLGIRTGDRRIIINPAKERAVQKDDQVILLAEDDSAIKFSKQKYKTTVRSVRPAGPRPQTIEKQLIVGWSQKTSAIIDEYSNYLTKGSGIDLMVPEIDDPTRRNFSMIQKKHPDIKMRLFKAKIDSPGIMEKLKPGQYNNVIILAGDGGVAELNDSETIAKLLEFRHYFKKARVNAENTQLITEVADSDNIEVIQEAGVRDFLISNQFVSKIYAQVSENPDVLAIYEDLFREEGCEVYLKPVHLFLSPVPPKISFGNLCAAALLRNESSIGVRILGEEKNRENNYGIYINPPKNEVFSLQEDDCLITIAEDET